MRDGDSIFCTFCGKRKREVRFLIASPIENVFICDECVRALVDMVGEREQPSPRKGSRNGYKK